MFRALFVCAALVSSAAFAQDDDDLPALPTAKPKAKPAPKAKAKPPPVAKPKAPVANDDDLPPLPAQKGEVLVKLQTPMKGAKLAIDDREIGALPQPAQAVSIGEHTVTVHRAGFSPFTKKVTVAANKTSDVSVFLEATAAVLSVSTDVVGAQVFVNGRFAGTAPLDELEVPPGKVELSVKKDGYHDGTQTVSVRAGHDYPIDVKLGAPTAAVAANDVPPAPVDLAPHSTIGSTELVGTTTVTSSAPIYQAWWFWTAVAVVAAGVGAILGYEIWKNTPPKVVHLGWDNFMCGGMPGKCDGWLQKPATAENAIVPIPR